MLRRCLPALCAFLDLEGAKMSVQLLLPPPREFYIGSCKMQRSEFAQPSFPSCQGSSPRLSYLPPVRQNGSPRVISPHTTDYCGTRKNNRSIGHPSSPSFLPFLANSQAAFWSQSNGGRGRSRWRRRRWMWWREMSDVA